MSGRRVEFIWAFLAVDPTDGNEGVVGALTPQGWRPLIGGDTERMEVLRSMAQEVGRQHQAPIRLVRFELRRDVEVLDGATGWQWAKLQ